MPTATQQKVLRDLSQEGTVERVEIGLSLAWSLAWGGEEERALQLAREIDASALGDPALAARAHLRVVELESWRDPRSWLGWKPAAEDAIPVF